MGTDGLDGATGPTGAQGLPGVAGATGPQGPTGAAGNDGLDGAIGPTGAQGLPGVAGATGSLGPMGAAGNDGLDGATGPTGPQGPTGSGGGTLDEAYDFGGAGAGRTIDATDGALRIDGEDGLLVTGTLNAGQDVEVTGAGIRMFFNPKKAAFRVGGVDAGASEFWDPDSIGNYSFASGHNTKATTWYSTAMGNNSYATGAYSMAAGYLARAYGTASLATGEQTIASGLRSTSMGYITRSTGNVSTAMGYLTKASGEFSTALGTETEAVGDRSTAMGSGTIASSFCETVVGQYNTEYTSVDTIDGNGLQTWSPTDRLFIIGNGILDSNMEPQRSDAMVVLKNGNTGIGSSTPDYRLEVEGYSASTNQVSIIPLWQAGSNYVMSNTFGADLSNCESGLIPTAYSATGDVDVKLVVRITSTTASTNNFQLRAHDGTTESYPIVNTDVWTFEATQTGFVASSEWKDFPAGTNFQELHLFGWVNTGSTNFNSAYLMVRPNR
ncbi:MAG: hypothetical protein ACI9LA_001730 [Bacteroidia bacterium]